MPGRELVMNSILDGGNSKGHLFAEAVNKPLGRGKLLEQSNFTDYLPASAKILVFHAAIT